jgi:hypothetical protein
MMIQISTRTAQNSSRQGSACLEDQAPDAALARRPSLLPRRARTNSAASNQRGAPLLKPKVVALAAASR